MPTLLRFRNFRIVIFTDDHDPPHVHAIGPGIAAIFNLHCQTQSVSVRRVDDVSAREISALSSFLTDNLDMLCEAWRKQHGNG